MHRNLWVLLPARSWLRRGAEEGMLQHLLRYPMQDLIVENIMNYKNKESQFCEIVEQH